MKNITIYLPIALFVIAIIALGTFVFSFSENNEPKIEENDMVIENIERLWSIGPEEAPVKIVEYSDFQCPYCSKAAATVKEIEAKYGDQVQITYKHFPLTSVHENAMLSAKAAESAGYQGKFWEMHDALFADQSNLSRKNILKLAQDIGLDMDKFATYLDNKNISAKVIQQQKEAESLGVNSTPTFFINETKLVGAQPLAEFDKVIAEELTKIVKRGK